MDKNGFCQCLSMENELSNSEIIFDWKEYKLKSDFEFIYIIKLGRSEKHIYFEAKTDNDIVYYTGKFNFQTISTLLKFPPSFFKDLSQIMELINNAFNKNKVKITINGKNKKNNRAIILFKIPIVYKEIECHLELNSVQLVSDEKFDLLLKEKNNLKSLINNGYQNNILPMNFNYLNRDVYRIKNGKESQIQNLENKIIENEKKIVEIEIKFKKEWEGIILY